MRDIGRTNARRALYSNRNRWRLLRWKTVGTPRAQLTFASSQQTVIVMFCGMMTRRTFGALQRSAPPVNALTQKLSRAYSRHHAVVLEFPP